MTGGGAPAAAGHVPAAGPLGRFAWHLRHNPKRELWIAFYTTIIFYNFYGVIFFGIARVQPPPDPSWDVATIVQWFDGLRLGLLGGFAVTFIIVGMTVASNALIAYSMFRMSVSRAFAYSYIALYSLSAIPGLLLTCIALTVGAMRPDRDPQHIAWLYDFAFMAFDGTMGVFLVGSLIWMLAIFLDKNRVLPRWFGYLCLCNALTEVVVAPAWLFLDGAFAWEGAITWWINMVVFIIFTGAFITLLRNMILREDFGTGPLPDLERG